MGRCQGYSGSQEVRGNTVEERKFRGKPAVGSPNEGGRIRPKQRYYTPGGFISQIMDSIEEEDLPRPRL